MFLNFLKKIFSTTADVYLSAVIFALGVFFYCNKAMSYTFEDVFFHTYFYIILLVSAIFLFFTKKTRQGLLFLMAVLGYVGLNCLKKQYDGGALLTISYHFISLFVTVNWFVYCLMNFLKLSKKFDFYFLCLLLIEASFIENLPILNIGELSSSAKFCIAAFQVVCLCGYMVYLSIFSSKENYGEFFAFLSLNLGLLYFENSFALSLFFGLSITILFGCMIYSFIYAYFKDSLTGVYSNHTFIRHAAKFPVKYSLGLICIDDYAKLLKVFKPIYLEKILKMAVNKIDELSMGAEIYRYHDDEFILVFYNEDKKKSFEYLENIRRAIAGAEFVLNSKRMVKITISAGVSEKKRSDADYDAVLTRTRDAVQRTYKFTQNMTTMA